MFPPFILKSELRVGSALDLFGGLIEGSQAEGLIIPVWGG